MFPIIFFPMNKKKVQEIRSLITYIPLFKSKENQGAYVYIKVQYKLKYINLILEYAYQ